MSSLPKIEIERTQLDETLDRLGWFLLILMWILFGYYFPKLPDIIPIHFNIARQADDFGSKFTIIMLPAIGTIIYIGLTILNRYPHIFNYPFKITEENAKRQYLLATRLIRFLKLS